MPSCSRIQCFQVCKSNLNQSFCWYAVTNLFVVSACLLSPHSLQILCLKVISIPLNMFQNISLSTFHNSSLFFFSSVLNFILLFSDCILTPIITLIYLHVPIVVHVGASQRLMKMSKKTGPHNSSFGTIHAQIHRCLSFFHRSLLFAISLQIYLELYSIHCFP